MDILRIASFQRPEIRNNTIAAISAITEDVAWSSQRGVDICLFPEAYFTGYPRDAKSVADLAVEIGAPCVQMLLKQTKHLSSTFVLGLIEREGSLFYNSALVVRQGAIIGVYRKQHANEVGISAGIRGLVFRQGAASIGINICNDANFHLTAKELAATGADIILYPLNNTLKRSTSELWRQRTLEVLKERARDTGCWIVSADVTGEDGDHISFGCTAAISSTGVAVERAIELHSAHVLIDIPMPIRT